MQVLNCFSQFVGLVHVLTDLRIGNSNSYNNVQANDNALPATPNGVDAVLNKLATNCLNNAGVCDLDNAGTNATPTGGAANPDYVALTTNVPPWTVVIN